MLLDFLCIVIRNKTILSIVALTVLLSMTTADTLYLFVEPKDLKACEFELEELNESEEEEKNSSISFEAPLEFDICINVILSSTLSLPLNQLSTKRSSRSFFKSKTPLCILFCSLKINCPPFL